jgi:hypothetical protein
VEPRELPATGGTVRFKATATDNLDVAEVYATVTMPGGGTTQVQMEQVDANRYEGALKLTANPTGSLREYGVTVTAGDYAGLLSSVDAGLRHGGGASPRWAAAGASRGTGLRQRQGREGGAALADRPQPREEGTALVYGNLVVSGAGYTFATRRASSASSSSPERRGGSRSISSRSGSAITTAPSRSSVVTALRRASRSTSQEGAAERRFQIAGPTAQRNT